MMHRPVPAPVTWSASGTQVSVKHRGSVRRLVPVPAAPVDRYLKAMGSNPPRTWISAMAQRLEQGGAKDLVAAARNWYMGKVETLLRDPKYGDEEGEYFLAFLRECHREIYNDIDTSRPETVLWRLRVQSLQHPTDRSKFHDLGQISMPDFETAAAEIMDFDPSSGEPASRRQRVMAKIIIDAFQRRLVGLSAILQIVERVLSLPEGSQAVVILCAGGDHTHSVEQFFRSQGFSSKELPARGRLGKDRWLDSESRALVLPSYLHDFREMFSVRPGGKRKRCSACGEVGSHAKALAR